MSRGHRGSGEGQGRRRHSLFWKLSLILLLTGVVINVLVLIAGRALFDRGPVAPRLAAINAKKYVEYLERDLGLPPSQAKIDTLAAELGIAIRVDFGGKAYLSEAGLLPPAELEDHVPRPSRRLGIGFGHADRRFFFTQARGPARYSLYGPRGVTFDLREEVVVALAIGLSLCVIGAYLALKRLFAPVRDLQTGVQRLAAGDLDYRVPERGSDELAGLAQSFNEMTGELRSMLLAKEQLLLDASHELRSPMTRMRVALEMMDDSKLKRMIAEDLQELDQLTGELLDSARLTQDPKPVALVALDLAVLGSSVVAAYAGRRPGVGWHGPTSGTIAAASDTHARRALTNLIENALKYSAEDAKPVDVRLEGNRLIVKDYGVGIPEAELEKVFEPFYRVDKARTPGAGMRGGFGLGLALVRKLMLAQGGTVHLASRVGEGTTATLEFRG